MEYAFRATCEIGYLMTKKSLNHWLNESLRQEGGCHKKFNQSFKRTTATCARVRDCLFFGRRRCRLTKSYIKPGGRNSASMRPVLINPTR